MDVLVLIDRLEELVEDAQLPRFRQHGDGRPGRLRHHRPDAPDYTGGAQAGRWIVKERQAMLDEARSESDRIIRSAQDEAEKITSKKRS